MFASEPEFYCDLVYKFNRIVVEKDYFSNEFKQIIKFYLKVGGTMNIVRQNFCLVIAIISSLILQDSVTTLTFIIDGWVVVWCLSLGQLTPVVSSDGLWITGHSLCFITFINKLFKQTVSV